MWAAPLHAQTTALFEDFEDASVEYVTSVPEFSDGDRDFFIRTDGSDLTGAYNVTGFNGSSFFAAQDVDGEGATLPVSLAFEGIDISGLTDLTLSALFAEDDDGSNEDWDNPDYLRVFATIDGGPEIQVFGIENDGSTFNSAPFVDTDFDGVGDGAEITDAFAGFAASIPGTGASLTLRFEFDLDSGDEDIAIDDVAVTGIAVAEDTTAPTCGIESSTDGPPAEIEFFLRDETALDPSTILVSADANAVLVGPISIDPGLEYVYRATQQDPSFPAQVTISGEDAAGNAASCTFTFGADDTEPPVCDPISFVPVDGTYEVLSGATDNVGIASVTFTTLTSNLDGFVDEGGMTFGPFMQGQTHTTGDPDPTSVGLRARFTTLSNGAFFVTVADAAGNEAVCDPVLTDLAGALPEATALLPSYPNPASGSAGTSVTVPFTLAEASEVRVVVYDVLGREVAVLADEAMEPGRYEVSWPEARSLASGTYVVRLAAGAHVQTQRLTLVR